MLGLRTKDGFDLNKICSNLTGGKQKILNTKIQKLIQEDLLTLKENNIFMNKKKWLLSDYAARELFTVQNMKMVLNNKTLEVDFNNPIDLSLTSRVKNGFKAWYVDEITINTIRNEEFVGSVNEGGAVNFREVLINPHGNMTHTESVGHISSEKIYVNDILKRFHFIAQVITIVPTKEIKTNTNGERELNYTI